MEYESIMHVIADKLVDHFDGVGAVNYIEQIFENKETGRNFVLTMQMKDGLTPCEKLSNAEAIITKQAEQIKMLREALEMFRPEIYYNQDGEEVDVGGNFTIYADGDADNEAMQKVHEALEATKD